MGPRFGMDIFICQTKVQAMEQYLEFAESLARLPGEMIRRHFLSQDLSVDRKEDRTVVTEADREAELQIRQAIHTTYPAHGIIAEEFGSEREDAEWTWVIDPIDGTLSFISGVPLFGTLVGLLHQRRPVIGCIYHPALDLCCIGTAEETRLNQIPVKVRDTTQLSEASLLVTDPLLVNEYQDSNRFGMLTANTSYVRTWGDCYGYTLVASGRADLMLDPIMNPWDLLPVIPVIQGAGGTITSWQGKDAAEATSAVAGNPELHQQALQILNVQN
jgi:histidinol phosphatase-like enzyme (inositol monophosphatase family)